MSIGFMGGIERFNCAFYATLLILLNMRSVKWNKASFPVL